MTLRPEACHREQSLKAAQKAAMMALAAGALMFIIGSQ
jgi:hypothetical protein